MKVVNQVLQTTDYDLFKFLQGNRAIHKPHLVRLRKSFERQYLFSPILVNEKYEIIDGQHRYTNAKELGLPINFIVVQGYDLNEVKVLNTNMSNWGQMDYLNAYCDLEYPHYILLRQFMYDFPDFGIRATQAILSQELNLYKSTTDKSIGNKKGNLYARSFEEGNFTVASYESGVEIANKILDFKPHYDGYHRATFVVSFMGILKINGYDHAQMIARIESNPRAMVHCSNVTQYKEMLEEIYNFRSRKKLSFKFS